MFQMVSRAVKKNIIFQSAAIIIRDQKLTLDLQHKVDEQLTKRLQFSAVVSELCFDSTPKVPIKNVLLRAIYVCS